MFMSIPHACIGEASTNHRFGMNYEECGNLDTSFMYEKSSTVLIWWQRSKQTSACVQDKEPFSLKGP